MAAGIWLEPGQLLLSGLIASLGLARPQPVTPRVDIPVVLQVPYVAQSELLCGGAAVAMIERWWGRRGVYADDFASLVRPDSGGILTTELLLATRARGWQAAAIHGTPALVQQSLRDSVPVVALIRVGANRFHYIVIVGWNSEEVVFHDPAVRPFATLSVKKFLAEWSGADEWAMLVRPEAPVAIPPAPRADPPVANDSLPCRPWLDQAADAAEINHLDDADRLLTTAATACPAEPLVLRELAGVRFRQGRQVEAVRLAEEYVRRDPVDTLGWQLLASSRYLTGNATEALLAWNAVGRPAVDLVRIDGSQHIRFSAMADAIAIPSGVLLTPARVALAQRRIADIPALALARVSYTAVPGGVVEVRAAVVERPVVEPMPWLLVSGALHAVARSEVGLTVSTPLGIGETWTVQWRWESADPREALRADIPARIGLPGVVELESSWAQYHFDASVPSAQRRTATLGFSSWLNSGIETRASMRLDRWSAAGEEDFVALSLGATVHALHDRLVLLAEGENGVPLDTAAAYTALRTRVAWHSPGDPAATSWSARLGGDWTSAGAPRGLWPIAGGDIARDIPLRAHAFVVDGALPAARSAQAIVHGGVAGDRPVATLGPLNVAVGLFLDAADIMAPANGPTGAQWYLDAGAGIRIGFPGAQWGAMRIDLARGLATDPRWALSVGLEHPWPLRLHR
jgi:hypothetical protein